MRQRAIIARHREYRWPRNERGQSLVFITITSAIVILALLVTYNVGQLSFYRIKLQNTADAAAYSAAVAQSRDLNFTAYMNRAVIANQVAVAQIVSLTGWARGFQDTYGGSLSSISTTLASMSALGAMWTTPFNTIKSASGPIKSVLDSVAPPLVKVMDALIKGLNIAAKGYHAAVLLSIPAQIIPDVIKANDPEAGVSFSIFGTAALLASGYSNYNFTQEFNPANQQDGDNRMANVIEASSDYFYKNRTLPAAIWPIPFLIDPTRLFTFGAGPFLMMHFHSGGGTYKTSAGNTTDHLQGVSSIDATGLFALMVVTFPILGIPCPCVWIPLILPAGGGAAIAGSNSWAAPTGISPGNNFTHRNATNTGVDPGAAVEYGAAHFNPMTFMAAWMVTGKGPGANMDTSAGIKPYYDLKKNATGSTSNSAQANSAAANNNQNIVAPAWVLEIERPANTFKTSSTYSIGGGTDGKLSLQEKMNGDRMRAIAKGESYFARPKALFPRADGKTEWGSLYSPYWQPRLVANSLVEQMGSIIGSNIF